MINLGDFWPFSNFNRRPADPWNPWSHLGDDIRWLWLNLYDFIVEFILRNSIFAIRFKKVLNGEPTSEVNLLYWENWVFILQQIGWFFLTLPVLVIYPLLTLLSLEYQIIRRPRRGEKNKQKWFFINGVLGSKEVIDLNCVYLEKRFNIGVTGILNKSYGLLWDAVEYLAGRNFKVETIPVYWATCNIIDELRNENIKNVKLISHSQGTVIASLVMEKLYLELSYTNELECLRKLEIYTFSNGCRDFINPGGLVSHIEHYVNKNDPIAKLGVLNNTINHRVDGEIFINERRNNGRGHLFNAYYSLNANDYSNSNGVSPRLLNIQGNVVNNLPINIHL